MLNADILTDILSGKTFSATTGLVSVGTTNETPVFLFKNPSGSGVNAIITHFRVGADSEVTRVIKRIYAKPTVTGDGTALTIVNMKVKDANDAVAVCGAYKSPTVSANGSGLSTTILPADMVTAGLEHTLVIEPGAYILVTLKHNTVSGASLHVDLKWIERTV